MGSARCRGAVLALALLGALAPARAGGGLKRALEQARTAASAGDAAGLQHALSEAVAEGGRGAVRGLLELAASFPPQREGLYWQVVSALTSLRAKAEVDTLADYLEARGDDPLARDLMLGLQGDHSDEALELLRRLLRPRAGPLHFLAIDRLGEMPRPDAVDLLLELLKREENSSSPLERRVRATLVALVGEDLGDRVNWVGWWAQQRETFFAPRAAAAGTGTVRDGLDRAREGGLASMSRRGGKVLVLRGDIKNFDEIERVLERLGLAHTLMQKTAFNQDPQALDGVAALILNCSYFGSVCRCRTCKPGTDPRSRLPVCTGCDKHELTPDQLDQEAIGRIQAWVARGGCVFTEDFGLRELTSRAWPEYLRAGPDLSGGEVDYAPAPGQADPSLLRGVLTRPRDTTTTAPRTAHWKVDDLSPSIVLPDPTKVQVLLVSQDLRAKAPSDPNAGAVAVAFSPGAQPAAPAEDARPTRRPRTGGRRGGQESVAPRTGLVLHVLSHFGKQKSQEDEFTLQNLLVNFLLEAQDRYAERAGRR